MNHETEQNLEQELSRIPPEYEEMFRDTIQRELAELTQNRTDTDILDYLRQRQEDFRCGGFIRPDGRTGVMTVKPEEKYGAALAQLAQASLGDGDDVAERRRTLIKVGVLLAVLLVVFLLAWRGRAQREAEKMAAEETAAVAPVEVDDATPGTAAPIQPTPALPEIASVDETLQTIGSLGGALTIGRPSAIELHYGRTGETIALAIDPSKPTPKGELRFNEVVMRSDNPVAIWVFGTVLNYGIGIPDSLVRNLAVGDQITLSTDTGAALTFVVAETRTGANYEAGRLLSQNRLGLTLFALPAQGAEDVALALANYDLGAATATTAPVYAPGEAIPLTGGREMTVTEVTFDHDAQGQLLVGVQGQGDVPIGESLLLSLVGPTEQTTAVTLLPDADGRWTATVPLATVPLGTVPLAMTMEGRPLLAELRRLPAGTVYRVELGNVPRLGQQLAVTVQDAWWDEAAGMVGVTAVLTHTGSGTVYLAPDFMQWISEGGDAYGGSGQDDPRLPGHRNWPQLIHPGETVGVTVTFLAEAPSGRLQIGADLWAVSDP
jgi:hypothetical protein